MTNNDAMEKIWIEWNRLNGNMSDRNDNYGITRHGFKEGFKAALKWCEGLHETGWRDFKYTGEMSDDNDENRDD